MSLSMSSSGMASSLNGSIHRLDKQPKNNQRVHHDKPIKKDINEMSISYGEQSWNGVGSNSISSQHSRYTSGMNLRNSRNGAFQGMQLEEDIYEDDFDTYDTKQDTKYSDSRVKRGK